MSRLSRSRVSFGTFDLALQGFVKGDRYLAWELELFSRSRRVVHLLVLSFLSPGDSCV